MVLILSESKAPLHREPGAEWRLDRSGRAEAARDIEVLCVRIPDDMQES
jgi:hypothetical protein